MGCACSTAVHKDEGQPADGLSLGKPPTTSACASENSSTTTIFANNDDNISKTMAAKPTANRFSTAGDIGPGGRLTEEQVKARQQGDEEAHLFCMDTLGVSIRYACLSQRGLYPDDLFKANQDRFLVVPKVINEHSILLGVFDGHGPDGDHCANYAKTALAPEIQRLHRPEGSRASLASVGPRELTRASMSESRAGTDMSCCAVRDRSGLGRRTSTPGATAKALRIKV